jgi:outer membrane protein assembly factor BamB
MSRRLLLAWVLLIPLGWPASGQTIMPGTLLPDRAALERLGLERGWYTAVPVAGTEQILRISMAENLVFAQTSQAMLHAYDAETGRLLWSASLGRPTGESQPIAVNSTGVFVTNAQHLLGLERTTGRVLWDQYLPARSTSATAATEDQAIVGLSNGRLVAYNLRAAHKEFALQQGPPGGFAWAWQTSGPITARPLPANRVVAFASRGGQIYVAQMDPPLMIFRSQPHGAFAGSLGWYGTRILLASSLDYNVYGIDLFTGEELWVYSAGAPVEQLPLVAGDDTYIINARGEISAIDPHNGQPRWGDASRATGGASLLGASPKRLYLQTSFGDLIILDRVAGTFLADARATLQRAGVNLRDYRLSLTNTHSDRFYLANPSGYLICLREIGAVQPTPLRDPKALGFGEIPRISAPTPPAEAPPAGDNPPAAAEPGANPM